MDAEELRTAAMQHAHHGRVRLVRWSKTENGEWLAVFGCADCEWSLAGQYPPETFGNDLELWDVFLR